MAWGIDFGFKVTPWDVEGEVDYSKLVEEFGVKPLDGELLEKLKTLAGELHPLISRGHFFAHRDLDLALKDYEDGKGFFLYTGRAPSKSSMHLGHLPPFVLTRWFQERFGANVYIMIPDEEKYLAKKADSLEKVQRLALEDITSIAALGFDPDRTFIFVDTDFARKLYKLAVRVARHINLSMAKAVYGFSGATTIGLVFYPAMQIAPTLFENKRPLIPCGIDQDPYFRLQRDVAEKLGAYKAAEILSKFIWGLEGPGSKMSASKPETAIFLTDPPEEGARKVMRAFTGGQPTAREQREKGGNPEVCSVFHWFKILFEPDDKKLEDRYHKCREGAIICGECKKELAERIKKFLEEHQKARKRARKLLRKFMYDGRLARQMWEEEDFLRKGI